MHLWQFHRTFSQDFQAHQSHRNSIKETYFATIMKCNNTFTSCFCSGCSKPVLKGDLILCIPLEIIWKLGGQGWRSVLSNYTTAWLFLFNTPPLQVSQKLEQTGAPDRLKEDMQNVKELFENMKRSAWSWNFWSCYYMGIYTAFSFFKLVIKLDASPS